MPITKFPPEIKKPTHLTCYLCQARIPLSQATLGPVTQDGQQLYSCAAHLRQASWQYLMSWIDITILYQNSSYAHHYGGASRGSIHARPVC